MNESEYIDKLREQLREYHKLEEELMANHLYFAESEIENLSDSYIWKRLRKLDVESDIHESRICIDIEDSPHNLLSDLLEAVLRISVPTGVNLHGLAVDRVGTQLRFCISGSISSEELQKICERYSSFHSQEDEM